MTFDWIAIAARIQGLLGTPRDTDLPELADRLKVPLDSLRMSVRGNPPLPTIDVIAALVRSYGLDPSWVLTGDYDPATHRTALESSTQEIEITVNRIVAKTTDGPRSSPRPGPHPQRHLAR